MNKFKFDPNALNGDAAKAVSNVLKDLAKHVVSHLPEGYQKNCGNVLVCSIEIADLLQFTFTHAASNDTFTEQQAQDAAEYLSCVKAGMEQFCHQQGLEVRYE